MAERLFATIDRDNTQWRSRIFDVTGRLIDADIWPGFGPAENYICGKASAYRSFSHIEDIPDGRRYFVMEADVPEQTQIVRQPRRARIEQVPPLLIGWWKYRPDEKCEVRGGLLLDILPSLASLARMDSSEFIDSLTAQRGWKTEFVGAMALEIVEVLRDPDSTAVKCERCGGLGRYEGFREVESPCSGCRGTGVQT